MKCVNFPSRECRGLRVCFVGRCFIYEVRCKTGIAKTLIATRTNKTIRSQDNNRACKRIDFQDQHYCMGADEHRRHGRPSQNLVSTIMEDVLQMESAWECYIYNRKIPVFNQSINQNTRNVVYSIHVHRLICAILLTM